MSLKLIKIKNPLFNIHECQFWHSCIVKRPLRVFTIDWAGAHNVKILQPLRVFTVDWAGRIT